MMQKRAELLVLALLLLVFTPAWAQEPVSSEGDQFAASATAIDAATLMTSQFLVSLWGVEPVNVPGTAVALRARTALDNLVNGQVIRCDVREWRQDKPIARCLNHAETDLALAMIEQGFAVVDRPSVTGTVFETSYTQAEKTAQKSAVGSWTGVKTNVDVAESLLKSDNPLVKFYLLALLGVPLLGFLLTWMIQGARLRKVEKNIVDLLTQTAAEKQEMKEQERFVVASMFEGELSANKGKLEAFIIIYKDMLKTLRLGKDYQAGAGEIVHETPSLERSIYEANAGRLDVLGPTIAAELASFYGRVEANPSYTTLDASILQEEAIIKVQKVVSDAEALIPKIDQLISSLHIIIRDNTIRQSGVRL